MFWGLLSTVSSNEKAQASAIGPPQRSYLLQSPCTTFGLLLPLPLPVLVLLGSRTLSAHESRTCRVCCFSHPRAVYCYYSSYHYIV